MKPLILIPSRMAATRLPGKPMLDIGGRPMIVQVWARAMEADAGRVVVAAGDEEIAAAIRAEGGEAVLTRPDHPSGSDRVKEAADLADPAGESGVVVNLQGDMPNVSPDALRAVLNLIETEPGFDITTPVAPITRAEEHTDPAVVKAILSLGPGGKWGRALYFTRATAPSGEGTRYHHLGVYAFRRAALDKFVTLPPSPLERQERLEQLRALEAGMTIGAALVSDIPVSVDTPADLERARGALGAKGAA